MLYLIENTLRRLITIQSLLIMKYVTFLWKPYVCVCVCVYLHERPALLRAEGNGLEKARQQSNAVNLETPFSAACCRHYHTALPPADTTDNSQPLNAHISPGV